MKITDVHVDGFGVWSNLGIDHLSPEVTVFYGPNEAGKTTLMQLVRAVLYGYSDDRRQRYLPPVFGGRAGGSLVVQGTRGRFTIDRRADRSDASGLGKVTVKAESGSTQGQHLLSMMLSGVDEAIFNNVFAVGLREIQELGTLSGTQAATHLFALTAGMDRVSLVDVMRDIRDRRDALVSPEGHGHLAELLARREKLTNEIDALRGKTQEWSALVGQQAAIERQTAEAEAEVAVLELRLKVVELADRIRERWADLQHVESEIAALLPLHEIPDDAQARYDDFTRQIAQQQETCDTLKAQWAELRAQAKKLPVNEGLRRNCCRLEALAEQEGWLNSIGEHIGWLHNDIAAIETELATERDELGLGNLDWDQLPHYRDRAESELRGLARQLKQATEDVEKTREQVAAHRQKAKNVSEQFETAMSDLGEESLTTALEKAGERLNLLRRRQQIDERVEQLKRHRNELEDDEDELAADQTLSGRAHVFIGGLFVAGVVCVLTGIMGKYFALTPGGSWLVALLGIAGIVGAILTKLALERVAATRLDECEDELERVIRQLKKAKDERDEIEALLPQGSSSGPIAVRINEAEKALAQLENLVPLDADLAEARTLDEATQNRARQAAATLKDLRQKWREALIDVGLPDGLSPAQIKRLVSRCDYILELEARLAQRRHESEKRNAELISLTARINRLGEEVALKNRAREPIEQLRQLVAANNDQREVLKQRDALLDRAKEIRHEYSEQARLRKELSRSRRQLLRELRVVSEEEMLACIERNAVHAQLSVRQRQLNSEIAAIVGDVSLDEIVQQLNDGDQEYLERQFDSISSQLASAEARQKDLYQERGRLSEQVKALEQDKRFTSATMDLSCLDAEIAEAAARWRVFAATSIILESVRHIYETERQPATLSDASRYLEKMTDGRYVRVWTPLDQDTLLVDDARGHALRIEVLSAGTREQVFLAIRLALVAMYARRGADLPLVLDDVLVNCDYKRTLAAAKVLCEFADEGHQLLIFTCHDHMLEIFKSLGADARRLPLRADLEEDETPAPIVLEAPPAPEPEPVAEVEEEDLAEDAEETLHEPFEEYVYEEPEPEPIAEIESQPFVFAPLPTGGQTWVEEAAPEPLDDEPFAELLQHAAQRNAW
jgi:uncharacterized protein YhaN